MHQLPSLKGLRVFEAAARHESFAMAADELGLTASAVSHRVRELEAELGLKLFHRRHRGIELSDAGRRYHGEVRVCLQRLARATDELRSEGGKDVIRVHSAPSFASQWLMPRLAQFVAAHPDVDIQLTASADIVDFAESLVDIDIRYGRRPSGDLAVVLLPPERISPLCRPDQVPPSIAALTALPLIHSQRCLVQWAQWFEAFHDRPVVPERGLRFDRSFMSLAAAADGLGIALESSLLAERELRLGRLTAPWPDKAIEVQGHFLCMPKATARSAKVRTFLDWLDARLAGNA
jgi:LysR family glycine cleavage system transcriptional activator